MAFILSTNAALERFTAQELAAETGALAGSEDSATDQPASAVTGPELYAVCQL